MVEETTLWEYQNIRRSMKMISDKMIEDIMKDLKKIGIKGFLVTGKEKEMSDKEREEGK